MAFPPELTHVPENTTSDTFVTVVDVVGSGFLNMIHLRCMDDNGEVKITIDGFSETLTVPNANRYLYFDLDPSINNIFEVSGNKNSLKCWFFTGLKVEHRIVLGSKMYTRVTYGIL
ncbi:hypothetical protein ES703_32173 [subsurface metagenome]